MLIVAIYGHGRALVFQNTCDNTFDSGLVSGHRQQISHRVFIYNKIREKQLDDGVVDNTFVDMLANACLHHEGRWTPGPAYRLEGYASVYAKAMHTIDMICSRRRVWEIMRDEWVSDAIG